LGGLKIGPASAGLFSDCMASAKAPKSVVERSIAGGIAAGASMNSSFAGPKILIWIVVASLGASGIARAASIDAQAINDAQWNEKKPDRSTIEPLMVKMQVLLDRAHFSPGEIDGKAGENVEKAIAAYARAHGAESGMTSALWKELSQTSQELAIVEHELSTDEVKGPFLQKMPPKMEDMKDLDRLGYTSAKEKIAERFHMSPELLAVLNPDQSFDKPGGTILVANVASEDLNEKAARIEVDKTKQILQVFGKSQNLLAVYPVTAGSAEKPAPDGVLKVVSVSKNPTYRYNPDYAFKGVKSREPFTIKPGPNNPVGLVWIGLNKEGYGIHGTPEPSKVSKTESHGCIRLTNWDALQLASVVSKGISVEFTGNEKERASRSNGQMSKRKKTR
jgi:lipoprotein-anchoring transpeptidase ErfK/SrfK